MSDRLDDILERGVLRVGARWDLTFEQFINPQTDEPDGVVARVGRLMAEELGVDIEFVIMEWRDQIEGLVNGRVDILLKHTNLPSRAVSVMFSDGVLLEYKGVVLVRDDFAGGGLEWLERTSKLAAIPGSLQESIIRRRFANATHVEVPDNDEGAALVVQGSVDGLVVDAGLQIPDGCDYLHEPDGELVVLSRDASHPAVANGEHRLLRWVDNFMNYHRLLGTLDEIVTASKEAHASSGVGASA